MEPIVEKAVKVLKSCQTPEHYEMAIQYMNIAEKRYVNRPTYRVIRKLKLVANTFYTVLNTDDHKEAVEKPNL